MVAAEHNLAERNSYWKTGPWNAPTYNVFLSRGWRVLSQFFRFARGTCRGTCSRNEPAEHALIKLLRWSPAGFLAVFFGSPAQHMSKVTRPRMTARMTCGWRVCSTAGRHDSGMVLWWFTWLLCKHMHYIHICIDVYDCLYLHVYGS